MLYDAVFINYIKTSNDGFGMVLSKWLYSWEKYAKSQEQGFIRLANFRPSIAPFGSNGFSRYNNPVESSSFNT